MGAIGLEWDENCIVINAEKEAQQEGVQCGWKVVMVNNTTSSDGTKLYEHLASARRLCGWTATSAQDFWKNTAKPKLERAVDHWPDKKDHPERLKRAMSSVKGLAKSFGKKEFTICFVKQESAKLLQLFDENYSRVKPSNEHDCTATFRTLAGAEHTISFSREETLRALRSRVASELGFFTDQVGIMLPNGSRLGETGLRREDATTLEDCGFIDGAEATVVVVQEPGDGCMEKLVDDDLRRRVTPLRAQAEALAGAKWDEFVPVSYAIGLNPTAAAPHFMAGDMLALSMMVNMPKNAAHVIECVFLMRPIGDEDINLSWSGASEMLRKPHFLTALAGYDGTSLRESAQGNISERQVTRIRDILGQIHEDATRLARFNASVYILFRWILYALPMVAPASSLSWARQMQGTERVVKCRIHAGAYVHVCVRSSMLNYPVTGGYGWKVVGVDSNMKLSDPIEWMPPPLNAKTSASKQEQHWRTKVIMKQGSQNWR